MMDDPESPMQTPPHSPMPHQSINQPPLHYDQSMSSLSSNQYSQASQASQMSSPTGDHTGQIMSDDELLSGPVSCGVCNGPCFMTVPAHRYLTCSGCLISAHIECYAISKMSKSHSRGQRRRWRCEKCRLDDLMRLTQHTPAIEHTLCKLCPNSEFALMLARPYRVNLRTGQPTLVESEPGFQVHPLLSAYDFVHTVCAIFVPGCRLEGHHQDYHTGMPLADSVPWATRKKHRSYQLIMGVDEIPLENRTHVCSICSIDTGAVVRCAHPFGLHSKEGETPAACDTWMHVTCALKNGLPLRCNQSASDPESVSCIVYCAQHATDVAPTLVTKPMLTEEYHQKLNSPSPERTAAQTEAVRAEGQ